MDVEVDINQNHDNFFSKQVVHAKTDSAFTPHCTNTKPPTESPSVSKLKLFFDEVHDDSVFDDDIGENNDDEGNDDETSSSDSSNGGFVKRRIERWEQLSQGDESDVTGAVIQGLSSLELRQRDPPAPVVIPPTFLQGSVSPLCEHHSETENELSFIRFNVIRMKADFQMTELKLNHAKWQYDVNKGNKRPVRTPKRNPALNWSNDNLSLPDIPENMAVRKRGEGAPNVAQQISLASFGNDGRRRDVLGHQHLINQAMLASSRGPNTRSTLSQSRLATPPFGSQGQTSSPARVNQGTVATQRRPTNNHGLEAMEPQLRNMNKPIEQKHPSPKRTLIAPLQPFGNIMHHSQRVGGSGGMESHDYQRNHQQTFDRSRTSNIQTSHAVQSPRTIPQRSLVTRSNVDLDHSGNHLPANQRDNRNNMVRSGTSSIHTYHAVPSRRTIPQGDMVLRTNKDLVQSRIQSNEHQRDQQHMIARSGPSNLHSPRTLSSPRAIVQDNMVTKTNEGLVQSEIKTPDYKSTVQHWFERSRPANLQTSHPLPDTRVVSQGGIVTRPNDKGNLKNERDMLLSALSDFLVEQDAVQQLEDELEDEMSSGGLSEGFGYDSDDSLEMGSSDTNDAGTQFPVSNGESLSEEQLEFETDESKCLIEGTSQTFQSSEFTYDVCTQVSVKPTPETTTNGFPAVILAQVDSPKEVELYVDNSELQEQMPTMTPLKETGDTRNKQDATFDGVEDNMLLPLNHPNDNEQFNDVSAHLGNVLEELALEIDTSNTPINVEGEEAPETMPERDETLMNNKNNASSVLVEEFIPSLKCSHDSAEINPTAVHREDVLRKLSTEMDSCDALVSVEQIRRERTHESSTHLDETLISPQSDTSKVVVEECVPRLKRSGDNVQFSAAGAHRIDDLEKLALQMENGNASANLERHDRVAETPSQGDVASSKNQSDTSKVVVEELVPRLKCSHDNAQFGTGSAHSGDIVEKLAYEMDNCNTSIKVEELEQVPENNQSDTSKVVVEEFVPRLTSSHDNVQFRSDGAYHDDSLEELTAEMGNANVDLEIPHESCSQVGETLPNSQCDTGKEVIAELVSHDNVQFSADATDHTDVFGRLADKTDNLNIPSTTEEQSPAKPTYPHQGPVDSHGDTSNTVAEDDQLHSDVSGPKVRHNSVGARPDDGSERLTFEENISTDTTNDDRGGLNVTGDLHIKAQPSVSEGEIPEYDQQDVAETHLDQLSMHIQRDTDKGDIEKMIHRLEVPDIQMHFETNDARRENSLEELPKEMDKSNNDPLVSHERKMYPTSSDTYDVCDDEKIICEVLAEDTKSSFNLLNLSSPTDEGKFHTAFETVLAIDEVAKDDPAIVKDDNATSKTTQEGTISKDGGVRDPVSPRRSKIPIPKSKLSRSSSCPTRNRSNGTVLNQSSKTPQDLRCEKDSSLNIESISDKPPNVTDNTPSPTFSKSFSFRHERGRSYFKEGKQQISHIPVPKSQFYRRGSCPVRSRPVNKESNGKSVTPISKYITNPRSHVPESEHHTGKKRSIDIDITTALAVGNGESPGTKDVTRDERSTCEIESVISDISKPLIHCGEESKRITDKDVQPLNKAPFDVDDFIQQAKQILSKIPVPQANIPETQSMPLHITASVGGGSQESKDPTGTTPGIHDKDSRAAPFPEKDMELLSLFLEVREDDTGSDTLTLHSENDSDMQTPTAEDMSEADGQISSKSRIPVLKGSPRSTQSSEPERRYSDDEAVDLASKERSVARISPMPRELEDKLNLTSTVRKSFRSKIPLPSPIAIKQPLAINRGRSYSETDGENTMVPENTIEEGQREEVEDTEDEVFRDQPSESEHEYTGFPRRSQSSREVRPRGSYWAFSTSPGLASSEFERSQTLRLNHSKNYGRRSPAVTPRTTPGGTPRTTPRGTPRVTPRSTQRNTPRSTPRDTPKGGSLRRQSPRAKTLPTFKSRECAFVPLPEWNRLREVLSSGEQSKQSTCPPSPSEYSYTSRRSSEEFQKVPSPSWGAPVTTPKPSRWRVDGRVPQHLKKKYSSMNDMGDPNDLYQSDLDDGVSGAVKEGTDSPWLKQSPIRASSSSQSVSLTDRHNGSQDRTAYLPGQRTPTNARVRSPYPVDTASDIQPMSSTENVSSIWTEDDTLESSNFSIPTGAKRKSWKRRFSIRRKKSVDPSKVESKESDRVKQEKKKRKNWILRFLGIRK